MIGQAQAAGMTELPSGMENGGFFQVDSFMSVGRESGRVRRRPTTNPIAHGETG